MPAVRVRGVDLYYEEHGEGPDLVFAHGLMGSVAVSPKFGERIEDIAARGVHVVAYDARGHGRSGYTTRRADYTWASLAEDMYGFIRAVGLQKTSVYGGSMGAGAALMLALEHADAVEKLILMAPPPFGKDLAAAQRSFGALAILYQFLGSRITARLLTMLPQVKQLQRANPGVDVRAFLASQRAEAIAPAIRAMLYDEPQLPLHRFERITQPSLVLTHPDDPLHPLSSGELLHERLPHAKLAVAPTASYWSDNPDALTHVVAAFVRGEEIARGLPQRLYHEHAAADVSH